MILDKTAQEWTRKARTRLKVQRTLHQRARALSEDVFGDTFVNLFRENLLAQCPT